MAPAAGAGQAEVHKAQAGKRLELRDPAVGMFSEAKRKGIANNHDIDEVFNRAIAEANASALPQFYRVDVESHLRRAELKRIDETSFENEEVFWIANPGTVPCFAERCAMDDGIGHRLQVWRQRGNEDAQSQF